MKYKHIAVEPFKNLATIVMINEDTQITLTKNFLTDEKEIEVTKNDIPVWKDLETEYAAEFKYLDDELEKPNWSKLIAEKKKIEKHGDRIFYIPYGIFNKEKNKKRNIMKSFLNFFKIITYLVKRSRN